MSARRAARLVSGASAFGAAAISFGWGLEGRSGSWLVAMAASLACLTLGYFVLDRARER